MQRRLLLSLTMLVSGCAGVRQTSPVGQAGDRRLLSCVPYARERSRLDLQGDGWQWWEAAAGRYARGYRPEANAVLVFSQSARLRGGHVAVVARLISTREIRVDHANWVSGRSGGPIALDQVVVDVSAANDWSAVRVWFPPVAALGQTVFPTRGFVLPRPAEPGEVRA